MVSAEKLRFGKGDWFAVAIVIVLGLSVLLCFLPRQTEQGGYAQIYRDGELVETLALAEPRTLTVTGRYTNQVTVLDGCISITDSDCPGQDCVHSGKLPKGGRVLVCLPNGVEIRIVSGETDVDFVVG